MNKIIKIEIAFAKSDKDQCILTIEIEEGSTIAAVIQAADIIAMYPEIDLAKHKVGIFGKHRVLSDTVKEGDRVEIYRPLTIDPKEARRAKARKNKN